MAQNFLRNAPLTGIGGSPLEPAISLGDYCRQFILQAPFAWRWNRNTTTFNTVAGTQDYAKSLPTFGWLESATRNDNAGTLQSVASMEVRLNVPEDKAAGPPMYVAPRLDDGVGNITFRVIPIPDAVYTITVTYQNAAPTFTNLTDTWAPMPDYMSNIYDEGFTAFCYEYFDDPRFAFAFQRFLQQLVSASEGLNDTQKSIMLEQYLLNTKQEQSVMQSQFGRQNRSGR